MTTVIAVDPGGTCGVATGRFEQGQVYVEAIELDPLKVLDYVSDGLRAGASLVVCENFTPRPGIKTWQPDALYTIGALRYLCYLSDIPLVLQMPGDAKSFATDSKLKKLGWFTSTKGGHANDALRHLLIAAVNTDLLDRKKIVGGI